LKKGKIDERKDAGFDIVRAVVRRGLLRQIAAGERLLIKLMEIVGRRRNRRCS